MLWQYPNGVPVLSVGRVFSPIVPAPVVAIIAVGPWCLLKRAEAFSFAYDEDRC